MLVTSGPRLPGDLPARLRTALGHAAAAIFRRNVGPGYTNIAVIGGGVCAAAGEILGQSWLLDYGRRRLQACVAHTEQHGGFSEYNSPTYTTVVVEECERILFLVRDPATRQAADQLRQIAWRTIAEHFHPATGQWAGPHARAYHDRLARAGLDLIEERTGASIVAPALDPTLPVPAGSPRTIPALPCPAELVGAFTHPLAQPAQRTHRFIKNADDRLSLRGTTWLARDVCLGSISREDFFYQRRPVLAYWRTDDEPAIVVKLRFLHNGHDFASALVRNAQQAQCVLTAINLVTDRGDTHPFFDRPGPAGFATEDLRLRYEILGRGAAAQQLGDGLYRLSAGPWSAVIHALPGQFGPWAVRWELGGTEGDRWLDAICYQGPKVQLQPDHCGEITLAAGLELIATDLAPGPVSPRWEPATAAANRLTWQDLTVETPRQTEKYEV